MLPLCLMIFKSEITKPASQNKIQPEGIKIRRPIKRTRLLLDRPSFHFTRLPSLWPVDGHALLNSYFSLLFVRCPYCPQIRTLCGCLLVAISFSEIVEEGHSCFFSSLHSLLEYRKTSAYGQTGEKECPLIKKVSFKLLV